MNILSTRLQRCFLHHQSTHLGSRITSIRLLFTREELGVVDFEKWRTHQRQQFKDSNEIKNYVADLSSSFSELQLHEKRDELKRFISVITGDSNELETLKMLLRRYFYEYNHTSHSIKPFHFGTPIMRLFYSIGSPDLALNYFNDRELNGIFQQQQTYKVLQDLLYKHRRYDDVFQLYQKLSKDLEVYASKPEKTLDCLAFAACYHLNTREHFYFALKLWDDVKSFNNLNRCKSLVAALALKQNEPKKALEIIGVNRNHVTPRFIALIADTQIGDFDNAIQILGETTNKFMDNLKRARKPRFNQQILENLENAINTSGTQKQIQRFMQIKTKIQKYKMIDNETLEHHLLKPFPTMMSKAAFRKAQMKKIYDEYNADC